MSVSVKVLRNFYLRHFRREFDFETWRLRSSPFVCYFVFSRLHRAMVVLFDLLRFLGFFHLIRDFEKSAIKPSRDLQLLVYSSRPGLFGSVAGISWKYFLQRKLKIRNSEIRDKASYLALNWKWHIRDFSEWLKSVKKKKATK